VIHLKNADAWAEMPLVEADSIDLIITDVPYMEYSSRGDSGGKEKPKDDIRRIQNVFTTEMFYTCAEHLYRVLKPNRHLYYWTQLGKPYIDSYLSLVQAGFYINQTLIWPKINHTKSGDFYQTYPAQAEVCLFCEKIIDPKNRRKLGGGVHSNLMTEFNPEPVPDFYLSAFPSIPSERMTHPTQKPVPLMEFLIKRSSLPGETVFDPFAGSGSVALACRNQKRSFLGYEIVEHFYKQTMFHLGV